MATYYVSPDGSDANNGLGPDASDASDKPWLTINKALAAGTPVSAGDTVWVAPGTYRRTTTITVAVSGSGGSPITIAGDPMNTKGFKTSGGVLRSAGPVIQTAYGTDEKTAPSSTVQLTLGGYDYLSFSDLVFVCSSATNGAIDAAATSTNITLTRCVFMAFINKQCLNMTNAANVPFVWLFDSCIFVGSGDATVVRCDVTTHAADYDADITFKNCDFLLGNTGIYFNSSSAGGGTGGGLEVINCRFIGQRQYGIRVLATGATLTNANDVVNNIFISAFSTSAVAAGHTAQMTENYNLFIAGTPRTTVNVGANSVSSNYAPYMEYGQSQLHGFLVRQLFSPWTITSPVLGFGSAGSPSPPTVDMLNKSRPSGGQITNAVGSYELHDYGVKETSVKDAGDASLKLTGPGDHEIRIPVDASATTIAIKARFDSGTYGGANYPQAILLDATEIGVSTETETATVAASDAWETLTFTQFTPTAKGWVTIRLVNRGSGGDDICYFDTIAVT